jgi:PAS domain S-box-containing protein
MPSQPTKSDLEKEIGALREEITELRAVESMHQQAQEGLQAIELQLAAIIHSAMDAIIAVDEGQRIFLFNAAAEKMFGSSAKDVVGQSIDRFIPPRHRQVHMEHIKTFGKTKVTNRRMGALGAISGLRANGEEFPIEASISHIKTAGKHLYTVILRDITERITAEQALQESQRTLSTLISNLPGMVYRFKNDSDRTIEFVSGRCQGLTGYAPEDFIVKRSVSYGRDLIAKEDQERVWSDVQLANKEKRPYQLSYTLNSPDGSKKWVWEQGCGVFTPDGTVAALEGYVFDVTQVRNLEEQLRKTERLAELGTLASGMAHEIGTPMNVILGRAELLMRKTTDETAKRGLETIVTQVERITKIMNQLLSFARKRPVERRPLDLSVVIKDILEVVQERMKSNNIQTQINLAPSVPEVFADPDQMSQVLLNLILNACQALPEGGTIRIGLQSHFPNVELTIADSGDGIPKENVSRLFDPFFTTKPVGEGTGLGLTVVHGIIQEHDGSISVDSEPGKGATFRILLPIYQPTN